MEVVVELSEDLEHELHAGGGSHQVGHSEVVGPISLTEATARHSHDTGLLKQLHAVKVVGLHL